MKRFAIVILCAAATALAQDARDLIARSVVRDIQDRERRKDYVFTQRTEQRELDSAGKPKSTESHAWEVISLSGRPYKRLVEKDGKPLSDADAAREKEKMEREAARRGQETDRDRARRKAEESKREAEEKKFREEIADAYLFHLAGEEPVSGHPAWIVGAEPRPGYSPRTAEGKILTKVKGKIWIGKEDMRWLKVDAEFIDTFALGWLLVRVHPGTRLQFEARKVMDEIWMPSRVYIRGDARVALVRRFNLELTTSWDNFRKFQTDSHILE